MGSDRITELRIGGLRTIDSLTLPLGGLTVLVGENGTGKSSILEACEILRRAARPQFFSELNGAHGGMFSLLRQGAAELTLGVTIEGEKNRPPVSYDITVHHDHSTTRISNESLSTGPDTRLKVPIRIFERTESGGWVYDHSASGKTVIGVQPNRSTLGNLGDIVPHDSISRMKSALEHIELYLPFEVLPAWAARTYGRASTMRSSTRIEPVDRLMCLGDNLANVFHALRTEYTDDHWQTTMAHVRLGLGQHIESLNARTDMGGGAIALWIKLEDREQQMPLASLSDGEIAYLAFVALYRLPTGSSLVAIDEPELHLHPGLLVRVVQMLESMAEERPVLLSTHSDRLLDALTDPARAVRVCEIVGEHRVTRLRELDPDALADWKDEYRGVGQLRSAGYLHTALKPQESR